jgi:NNP family nitrate/nitrite transporter-like MFS transporter
VGYAHVALYIFVPFVAFYFWAARYERHPEAHGLLTSSFMAERA